MLVNPLYRQRQLASDDFVPFDDQGLLPSHQGNRFGPSRKHVGRDQNPEKCPLHRVAVLPCLGSVRAIG